MLYTSTTLINVPSPGSKFFLLSLTPIIISALWCGQLVSPVPPSLCPPLHTPLFFLLEELMQQTPLNRANLSQ